MAFLAGLAADLVEWLLTKVWVAASALAEKLEKRSANKDAAQASVQPLKGAKTGDEIDKATDSTLGGL